jgi:hypothetical protein
MLVDGGAAVNLMSYAMLRKIGKSDEDLTQTDMMLVDFEGNISPAQGAICMELTIGSKTLPTTFFVIKGRGLLTDKIRIPLRSASVRTPHLFHHGIPKVLVNPQSKGITSVRSTMTHLATKTLTYY